MRSMAQNTSQIGLKEDGLVSRQITEISTDYIVAYKRLNSVLGATLLTAVNVTSVKARPAAI